MTVAHQPSIIALTEVKPKNCLQRLSISEISILGYCTHSNIDDQEDSNRGIVIYVKEELSHQVGNIYFKTDFNEQVWISIKLKKSDELIFGCLYRSPKLNTDNHSSLLKLIEEANQKNSSHMVLVGDFNYPGIDWNNLTATRIEEKQFLESVCDNFLCQHVEEATKIRIGQSPNMLDLIFSNEEGMICNVNYLPGLGRSDHICLLFQLNLYTNDSASKKESFRFPKGDYEAMNLAINNQQWDMIRNSPNVNNAWDDFHSTILNLMNIHIYRSPGTDITKRRIHG